MIGICVDPMQEAAALDWFKAQQIEVTGPIEARTPNNRICKYYGVGNSNDVHVWGTIVVIGKEQSWFLGAMIK